MFIKNKMVNKKLRSVGEKLNVSEKDIKNIKKAGFLNKIWYWIIAVLIAIITFIIGFFVGKANCPASTGGLPPGYPYASAIIALPALYSKKKSSKIFLLLVSTLAFLIALKTPVFGQAILYNVYKK
jgi:hypothetical protein